MTSTVPGLYRDGLHCTRSTSACDGGLRQDCMQGFQRILYLSPGGGASRPIAILPDAIKNVTSIVLEDLQGTKTADCCTNYQLPHPIRVANVDSSLMARRTPAMLTDLRTEDSIAQVHKQGKRPRHLSTASSLYHTNLPSTQLTVWWPNFSHPPFS